MTGLRRANLNDVAKIAVIEARCFERVEERFDEAKIAALLANRRTIALVCEGAGSGTIGWAAGFTRTHQTPRWGRLYALAVDPAVQGKGIGRQLAAELISQMRKIGADEFYLEVRPDNAGAIQLYRQCGFSDCRLLPNFYAPGVHGQRMVMKV